MNPGPLNHFLYREVDTGADQTLFLLHGTGGDENDLLPLVEPLAEHFNFLGLRGNVVENGMARFFERSSAGVFNQDSIRSEANAFAKFIQAWVEQKKTSIESLTFVGYSNGANMILALLFLYPELVQRAVLLHPMLPFVPPTLKLDDTKILLTYGENDQLIPALLSRQVHKTLIQNGADVTLVVHDGGHEVRSEEKKALISFLSPAT